MKKTVLVAALLFAAISNAQKGSILVAGSLGLGTTKNETTYGESKTNFYQFMPKVGYQFNDHWTVGIESALNFGKSQTFYGLPPDTAESYNKNSSISTGAFVRYTIPLGSIFSVYGDLGSGYQFTHSSGYSVKEGIYSTLPSTDGTGFYAQFTPAVFINIKNNFGLNFGFGNIGYHHGKVEDQKTNSFEVGFGNSFTIGLSKNFM